MDQKGETLTQDLQRRLKLCGLSQAAIAERTGIAQSAICKVITGRASPTLRNYEKLVALLDLLEAAKRGQQAAAQLAGAQVSDGA